MGVENFYQGEELSARKLNQLVCAINNLCSTMQALQREQTIASLGQNDRPRLLTRVKECYGEDICWNKRTYFLRMVHDTICVYMPPWGVLGVRREEWDELICAYVTKSYYYIQAGVWKEGQARPAGTWCSKGHEYGDDSDGLEGQWVGPGWLGGWIKAPEGTRRYLYATNCGKLVLRDSMVYDWRYLRLIADLSAQSTVNCGSVMSIARNGCVEELFFPVQYWTGDICQPKARWEQGGMFSVRLNPREGRVHICGGTALVEGPLAVGGTKTFDYATQRTNTELRVLSGTGAYYQVPGFNSNIPFAQAGSRQYLYLGYDAVKTADSRFWWFWRVETVAYARTDIPIFVWSVGTTSEVAYCNTYVMCTTWQTSECNYDNWKMAVPMGVAYAGECGYVCVAVAQHVPQFRARPIVNLQNAGAICSSGNDWACEGYKTPCGCQVAWVGVNEGQICEVYGDVNGVYVDVLREVYVEWDCGLC